MVTFGDDPVHDPETETFQSVVVSEPTSIIRTRKPGLYNTVYNYEYHLVQQAGAWWIASVLYVDNEGKYECL